MKKLLFVSVCIFGFSELFAGGIITNTNQSASWARNPSTAATTGTEATYYNPAATALLGKGLHFSISNQSIFQTRDIENSYANLNDSKFKGTIKAPIFPSVYAVYNLDKFAFSFGFNPIGGGGGAEFKKGLPSFDLPLASLVPTFQSAGVTGYSLDAYFKGTSIYFGYQFGIAYKINDMVSVFGGLRYVTAKNTYEGYLRDLNLVTASGSYNPAAFMTSLAGQLNAGAVQLNGAATNVGTFVTSFGGTTTFNDAITAAAGNTAAVAGLTALRDGLTSNGIANAGSLPLANGQATYTAIANGYTGQANQLTAQIPGATVLTADQEADVEQTGSGICPIIGVNLSLLENKLNVGLKYEFATKIEIKNKTSKDVITGFTATATPITMFPDGAKTSADMPALLSLGLSYKVIEKLSVSGSAYYYFDKNVSYGKKSMFTGEFVSNDSTTNSNFIDIAVGVEYSLTEKLLLSAGFLYGKTGIKPEYNSDLSFSNSSTTLGIGGKYSISPKFALNLGVAYTMYEKSDKIIAKYSNAVESYVKNTILFGVGVDINL